jgi:hypothetical protein
MPQRRLTSGRGQVVVAVVEVGHAGKARSVEGVCLAVGADQCRVAVGVVGESTADSTEGEHSGDEPEAVVGRRVLVGALRRVDHLRQFDRHHVSAVIGDLVDRANLPGQGVGGAGGRPGRRRCPRAGCLGGAAAGSDEGTARMLKIRAGQRLCGGSGDAGVIMDPSLEGLDARPPR